jgi:hypothetical protein
MMISRNFTAVNIITGIIILSPYIIGKRIKNHITKQILAKEKEECTFKPKVIDYEYTDDRDENRFISTMIPNGWFGYHDPFQLQSSSKPNDSNPSASSKTGKSIIKAKINLKEPERLQRDIRIAQLEKEQKRRTDLIAKEIEELQECTFQPNLVAEKQKFLQQRNANKASGGR